MGVVRDPVLSFLLEIGHTAETAALLALGDSRVAPGVG
jgi:hypothetical protein